MFSLLLYAQLAAVVPARDSTYASGALEATVAAAALANRRPPETLRAYRSHIETEMSVLIRDTLGREHTAEVEQFATSARWNRDGRYDLHVVGYRSQSVGVPYSSLSLVRGWTLPTLYGERLSLGTYFPGSRPSSDTIVSVHPFAADRARYYRFAGGDTVAVLRAGGRRIPLVRILIRPYVRETTPLALFSGEIDLDADRSQIVRMRGQFTVVGAAPSRRDALMRRAVVAVAYIEFVNAQVADKYWLPAFQRTEFQASFPLLGGARPVFRLVSKVSGISVEESAGLEARYSDSLRVALTWAPSDSIARFKDWEGDTGALSGSVHADDFQDIAPDVWRSDGPPRLNLFPNATTRILRFNRVEGLFTGVAPTVDFRSAVPGLSVGADIGWAWSEATARGGVSAAYRTGQWILGARAERSLVSTNDFAPPLSDDGGVGALVSSIDDHDYVDRRSALASFAKMLGSIDAGLLTLQLGVGDDRGDRSHLAHGLFHGGPAFRANRGVAEGRYVVVRSDLEIHPNVTGDFVQPGVGARAHYEAASGELQWQRFELGLSARQHKGQVAVSAHADGGMAIGRSLPPQQLFELGGDLSLPGYDYKQFVGDRAALFRAFGSYRFGLWERPVHFWRTLYRPGVSPGIAVGAQGGWTQISSAGALRSIELLSAHSDAGLPVGATGGMRTTLGGGLTLFSDIVHVGVARPLDHSAPWKLVVGFGTTF